MVQIGGHARPACFNLNVGSGFAHGFSNPPVTPILFYIRDGLGFNGERFVFEHETEPPEVGAAALDPIVEKYYGDSLFN